MDTEKVEIFTAFLFGVFESIFLLKWRENLNAWKKIRRFGSSSLEHWGFPKI